MITREQIQRAKWAAQDGRDVTYTYKDSVEVFDLAIRYAANHPFGDGDRSFVDKSHLDA